MPWSRLCRHRRVPSVPQTADLREEEVVVVVAAVAVLPQPVAVGAAEVAEVGVAARLRLGLPAVAGRSTWEEAARPAAILRRAAEAVASGKAAATGKAATGSTAAVTSAARS